MSTDDRSQGHAAQGGGPEAEAAASAAWQYAQTYYGGGEVMRDFELLARYRPEVFQGYIGFRRAAFNTGDGAALSPKLKELIILAIEIARTKTNPPPVGHARKAIESGATPAEVAEVASLCILIGGMLTYKSPAGSRFEPRRSERRN